MTNPKSNRTRLHRSSALVVALFSMAMLSGCVGGAPFAGRISAQPSPVLKLSWAEARWTKAGLVVFGQVRQVHCCTNLRGHIRVEAKDANELVIASTETPWGTFNPRDLHLALFKCTLPVSVRSGVSALSFQFVVKAGRVS